MKPSQVQLLERGHTYKDKIGSYRLLFEALHVMAPSEKKLPTKSSKEEVESFLSKVANTRPPTRGKDTRGRLLFAMDATASREPTWDRACHIQAEMFSTTAQLGGLDIQLCYYRGFNEFTATPWCSDSGALLRQMTGVTCLGGATQIARILEFALKETRHRRINALVFVGDCMEEDVDHLCDLAGRLGLVGVPTFVFHEGFDALAEKTFRTIARLSGGAYCRFDANSAEQLRELLSAVAVFAAGGRRALEFLGRKRGGLTERLGHQLDDSPG